MKFCNKCEERKPFKEFGVHTAGKDGLKPSCKSCVAIYNKRYKIANMGNYYGKIR
jgi:hypothetical protein